ARLPRHAPTGSRSSPKRHSHGWSGPSSMATMDRAARTQLVADATALHEFAGRLLAARQTARRSGESARRIISSRTFPLSVPGAFELDAHDRDDPSSTREQASGRLLLLRPDDASLLRTVSEAQRL